MGYKLKKGMAENRFWKLFEAGIKVLCTDDLVSLSFRGRYLRHLSKLWLTTNGKIQTTFSVGIRWIEGSTQQTLLFRILERI